MLMRLPQFPLKASIETPGSGESNEPMTHCFAPVATKLYHTLRTGYVTHEDAGDGIAEAVPIPVLDANSTGTFPGATGSTVACAQSKFEVLCAAAVLL